MKKINFKNVVWKEGRHYVAQCLNIDVSSFGKNKKEALANLYEALALYFEDKKGSEFSEVENPEVFDLSLKNA